MSTDRYIDIYTFLFVYLLIVNHARPIDCRLDLSNIHVQKRQVLIEHTVELRCSLQISGGDQASQQHQPPGNIIAAGGAKSAANAPPNNLNDGGGPTRATTTATATVKNDRQQSQSKSQSRPSPLFARSSSSPAAAISFPSSLYSWFSSSASVSASSSVSAASASSTTTDDGVMLIYWFKGLETSQPFLTIDARELYHERYMKSFFIPSRYFGQYPEAVLPDINDTVSSQQQQSVEQNNTIMFRMTGVNDALIDRVSHRLDFNNQYSYLIINNVSLVDEDIYRCRVDFRHARTINHYIQFELIVPPSDLIIMDQNGTMLNQENCTIGPYLVGQQPEFSCETDYVKPTPKIFWYENAFLADSTFEIIRAKNNETINNEHIDSVQFNETIIGDEDFFEDFNIKPLIKAANRFVLLRPLTRWDVDKRFRCSASNTDLVDPISVTFHIDMILAPLSVEIVLDSNQIFHIGEQVQAVCRSFGSKPSAELIWYRNDAKFTNLTEEFYEIEYNQTASILTFMATIQDDGIMIGCEAINTLLPLDQTIKDVAMITVHYPPIVIVEMIEPSTSSSLGLNVTINNNNGVVNGGWAHENVSVQLLCLVQANPPVLVRPIVWYFNQTLIIQSFDEDPSKLVIDHLSYQQHHGHYRCEAENSQGLTRSADFFLDVSYAPICSEAKDFGIALNQTINIECDVDAKPSLIYFKWYFNDTMVSRVKYTTRGMKSILAYTPKTMADYGVFTCQAQNSVGKMLEPCRYRVYPQDKPDPIKRCTLAQFENQHPFIKCDYGFNGGLRSYCSLEILRFNDSLFLMNMTDNEKLSNFKDTCLFYPLNFTWDQIKLNVYAYNQKGSSDPYQFLLDMVIPTSEPILLMNLLGVTEEPNNLDHDHDPDHDHDHDHDHHDDHNDHNSNKSNKEIDKYYHYNHTIINIDIFGNDVLVETNRSDWIEQTRRFYRDLLNKDRLFKRGNWIFLIICAILFLMVVCVLKFAANEPQLDDDDQDEYGDDQQPLSPQTILPPMIHSSQVQPFMPQPPFELFEHSRLDCHELCEEFAWRETAEIPATIHYQASIDVDQLHQFHHEDHRHLIDETEHGHRHHHRHSRAPRLPPSFPPPPPPPEASPAAGGGAAAAATTRAGSESPPCLANLSRQVLIDMETNPFPEYSYERMRDDEDEDDDDDHHGRGGSPIEMQEFGDTQNKPERHVHFGDVNVYCSFESLPHQQQPAPPQGYPSRNLYCQNPNHFHRNRHQHHHRHRHQPLDGQQPNDNPPNGPPPSPPQQPQFHHPDYQSSPLYQLLDNIGDGCLGESIDGVANSKV